MQISFSGFRNLFLLFLSVVLFISESRGQSNFKRGHVITLAGDTLQGLIDDMEWRSGPETISYRQDSTGELRTFSPEQLQGFEIRNGDRYISRQVTMHLLPHSLESYDSFRDTILARRHLILRVLCSGMANLYYYMDENDRDHFFIEKKGLPLDELKILESVRIDASGYRVIVSENRYQSSLKYYFSDCNEVVAKIPKVRFNDKSMQGIFESYNRCVDPDYHPNTPKESTAKIAWGVSGGLMISQLDLVSDEPYLDNAQFPSSTNATGALFMDLVISRNRLRTRWCNELAYLSYQTSTTVNPYIYIGQQYTEMLTADAQYLRLSTMISYDLTAHEALRPFVKFGFSFAQALNIEATKTLNPAYYGTSEFHMLDDINHHEEGIFLSLGCRKNRMQLEVRYDRTTGFSIKNVGTPVQRIAFLIGYYIGQP